MGRVIIKLYIAGKISKESQFGTHYWRDDFCQKLATMSGLPLTHTDPLKDEASTDPYQIFKKDCQLINQCDVFVIYLSDDISVGGSQEMLIARHFEKPVIAYAPHGGKFNNATREMFGKIVTDYKDPFVFSTSSIVCGTLEEVSTALCNVQNLPNDSLTTLLNDTIIESE